VQAPVLSHPVAPQVGSEVLHAAVQQLPVPFVPQIIEVQAPLEVQGEPSARSVTQAPELQEKPVTQSVLALHIVRQPLPALLHCRLLGHAMGLPTLQVPAPLQEPSVIIAALQAAVPQAVLEEG
jgi:hypothetical protein